MRSLHADLVAAQKAATADPAVSVVAENKRNGIRALDFALIDATAQTVASHGAACTADDALQRVRSDGAGTVYHQRIANPIAGPWNAWTNLAAAVGNVVAIAAKGTRVAVVYVDAAGTGIYLRESTDSGVTFGAAALVTTAAAAVTGLAVAYKNVAGDMGVAWTTATTLSIIKRVAGAWGAASGSGIGVASLNGVGMCYGWDYDLLLTGQEVTTTRRTLWTIVHGDGQDAAAGTWTALLIQQQAEADASVTYSAPYVAFADTYHFRWCEADAFAGGNTRAFRSHLHPFTTYIIGAWTLRAPIPTSYAGAQGLAVALSTTYAYECAADTLRAASRATVTADVSANVISLELNEREHSSSGYVDVDNSAGLYTPGVAPFAIGNLVTVALGYRTVSGIRTSQLPDLAVAGYEHRRAGGESVLRILLEGAWENLARNRQRTQIVHAGDTYQSIIGRTFARAGLRLVFSGSSARSAAVTPKFTVHPETTGQAAVRQALDFLTDRIRLTNLQGATMREPLAGDASTYAYGVAHAVYELRVTTLAPPVAEAHAFGAGAFGESIDYAAAAQLGATKELMRDTTSTTGATAAATAAARLRRRALDVDAGHLVAPPNVGTELYDVVDVTDPPLGLVATKRRVRAIAWTYAPLRGRYEHRLELMPL